jgi:hypothetical protein
MEERALKVRRKALCLRGGASACVALRARGLRRARCAPEARGARAARLRRAARAARGEAAAARARVADAPLSPPFLRFRACIAFFRRVRRPRRAWTPPRSSPPCWRAPRCAPTPPHCAARARGAARRGARPSGPRIGQCSLADRFRDFRRVPACRARAQAAPTQRHHVKKALARLLDAGTLLLDGRRVRLAPPAPPVMMLVPKKKAAAAPAAKKKGAAKKATTPAKKAKKVPTKPRSARGKAGKKVAGAAAKPKARVRLRVFARCVCARARASFTHSFLHPRAQKAAVGGKKK